MKNIYYIFVLLVLWSCKTKKITTNNELKTENSTISAKDFTIVNGDSILKEDLLYTLKNVQIENKHLIAKMQYGGGCVKPHIFQLVTNGLIDEKGNMSFFILHKTHNDYCKALLTEERIFDLSELYDLKSERLKTITINEMKNLPLH